MQNKVVIISGGSRGLGKGIVAHLLETGWCVGTFSRQSSPFIEKNLSNTNKDKFHWEKFDGTDFGKMEQFCKNVYKKFGSVDAVINNAGIATEGILTLMPKENITQVIAVNLESAIQLTRICSRYLLLKKGGSIINISSINGIRGHLGVTVYGATKAALDGFTRGLAKELGSRNIRANSIAPGYLDTEMTQSLSDTVKNRIIRRTPLGRLGKVADVVAVVDFLLSPQAQFVTGQTIVVDGGFTS